jgi:thiol-disulfide isomerase/thioredoxin
MIKTVLLMAIVFGIVIVAAIVAFVQNESGVKQMRYNTANQLSVDGSFPPLSGATEWFNSEPLTPADLRGKVVLVNFWTYTCINWLRQFPYVRAWAEKYKDQGLVVIGVHTPEFAFEHDLDNVRREIHDLKVEFPVTVDNAYAIWHAFNNHYWPALYFIDAQGHIRHQQFGEGNYEESERIIQQLLAEAGKTGIGDQLVSVEAQGVEVAADWTNLQTPETYVGYDRTQNFASPSGEILGKSHVYAAPERLLLNNWALSGDWTMDHSFVRLNQPNGRIVYRFHARDLHLVMGPATPGTSVRFRVLINGQAPGAAHGTDVDEAGNGTVTEQTLYQLIRQSGTIVERQFEIDFLDTGVAVYAFTFG